MTSYTMLSPVQPDAVERDLRARFEEWLDNLCVDPVRHGRFANTLSMLEHIGSVKIARTQTGRTVTGQVLQHLSEEARHADLLKRLAGKISDDAGDDYRDDRLIAGAAARGYFARLDARVRRFVQEELPEGIRKPAAYGLVTWLVECRAMWLYPAWQRALGKRKLPFSVRSIIGEETRHLREIAESIEELGIADHPGVAELSRFEYSQFQRLATEMMDM